MLYPFLFLAGSTVGFLSGLLGIGGGIVMFPILLYLPPLFDIGPIGVKHITGLTMIQGFFASLSAVLFYHKQRLVHKPLVVTLGFSFFFASLAGSFISKWTPDRVLLFVFGLLALAASAAMLLRRDYSADDVTEDKVFFHKPTAVIAGTMIGFLVGMVGQGGAFIIIPLLLYVLKVPLRVAMGSTLGIGLFSASAGLAGKIVTGQVPLLMALALLAGAVPSAQVGSRVSRRVKSRYLKWLLAILITAAAIKVWADIFFTHR
jgi:uncharacterized membrane protein YfcA